MITENQWKVIEERVKMLPDDYELRIGILNEVGAVK